MTRGIFLTGFRKSGSETSAWACSTALFALMHGVNIVTGSARAEGLPQIMNAFLRGTLFYLTRRATGGLVVPIVFHAIWDFSLMSHGGSQAAVVPGAGTLLQSLQPILVVVFFVVVMIAHKQWMESKEPQRAT